jgi:hypothetical protein
MGESVRLQVLTFRRLFKEASNESYQQKDKRPRVAA